MFSKNAIWRLWGEKYQGIQHSGVLLFASPGGEISTKKIIVRGGGARRDQEVQRCGETPSHLGRGRQTRDGGLSAPGDVFAVLLSRELDSEAVCPGVMME